MNAVSNVDPEGSDKAPMVKSQSSTGRLSCVTFSDVMVYPRARELRVNGRLVKINTCSFEILLMLIEADGQIVSKRDLFRRLWPKICVAETNLRVHVCKLRRALGSNAKAIKTAPNRGYVLTAPLTLSAEPIAASAIQPLEQQASSHVRAPVGTTVVITEDDKDMKAALGALMRSVRLRVEDHFALRVSENCAVSFASDGIVLNVVLGGDACGDDGTGT
jgi:DNA-binding winged helix-turn-helix (wHTH) protein